MVSASSNIKSSNNSSTKWLYVMLFITLAVTTWTAFNTDSQTNSDNELVSDKFAKNSHKYQSSHSFNMGDEELKNINNGSLDKTYSLIPWQQLKRNSLEHDPHDVFKVHSWVEVPPVKRMKPLPLPPPVAPKAPFTYMGKLESSPKGTQVFLMGNNKLYSVVIGENVDAQWRLDSEDAKALQFTYLPLNLKQVLSKLAKQAIPIAEEVNQ